MALSHNIKGALYPILYSSSSQWSYSKRLTHLTQDDTNVIHNRLGRLHLCGIRRNPTAVVQLGVAGTSDCLTKSWGFTLSMGTLQVVLTHFRGPLLLPFTLGVATKVGQLHLRRLLFVAIRRHVAQRRVPAPPVVESLNEVEDGSPRLVRIPELVTVQQLALDRREAEFAGVVPSEYTA